MHCVFVVVIVLSSVTQRPTHRKGPTMTKKQLHIFLWSFPAAVIVYALLAVWSYGQRGYFAFGGECMAVMIPFYTYMIVMLRG